MDTYFKISDSDPTLIENAFHQARGRRTLDEFAFDSGYTPRSFYRISHNEYLNESPTRRVLVSAGEHADPKSGIDEDGMLAAAGYISGKYLRAVVLNDRLRYRMVQKDGTKYTADGLRGFCSDEISAEEEETLRYVRFVETLSYYARDMERNQEDFLYRKARTLYRSKSIVYMLERYQEYSMEEEQEAVNCLSEYYLSDTAKLPERADYGASAYKEMLDSIIF